MLQQHKTAPILQPAILGAAKQQQHESASGSKKRAASATDIQIGQEHRIQQHRTAEQQNIRNRDQQIQYSAPVAPEQQKKKHERWAAASAAWRSVHGAATAMGSWARGLFGWTDEDVLGKKLAPVAAVSNCISISLTLAT